MGLCVDPGVIDNINSTAIGRSNIHGLGLFSTAFIVCGEELCLLDGQRVPWGKYTRCQRAYEWNALEGDVLLVRPYRTKYSYINHSLHPNLVVLHDPVRLVAACDIKSGEELTLNYLQEPLPLEYLSLESNSYLYGNV